jgi:hypothetical protein
LCCGVELCLLLLDLLFTTFTFFTSAVAGFHSYCAVTMHFRWAVVFYNCDCRIWLAESSPSENTI